MMPFDFCTVWTRLLMKKDNVICNEKDLQLGTEYFFPKLESDSGESEHFIPNC